jgi:aspartyl-tRNA(Asn)/glutamyl-tRNA(Gln) amidotransferase subunit A
VAVNGPDDTVRLLPATTPSTLREQVDGVQRAEVSSIESVAGALDEAERLNPTLRAFFAVDRDSALAAAAEHDAAVAEGRSLGALHGVPIAVKDNMDTAGLTTTSGSRLHVARVPSRDAAVVERIRRAGAVVIGKTSMDEFAWGATGSNPLLEQARNPHDLTRFAAGSSSGSGVAVAAGIVSGALGSDTGGSVRLPAATCGVVGFRPTTGTIDRRGVTPLAWSFDTVGSMAGTVADARLLFDTIRDSPVIPPHAIDVSRLRIGRFSALLPFGVQHEVAAALAATEEALARAGAEFVDLDERFPSLLEFLAPWQIAHYAEPAAAHLELLRTRSAEYGPGALTPLMIGLGVNAADYLQALRLRRVFMAMVDAALDGIDVLLSPTMPFTAVPIGEYESVTIEGQQVPLFHALPSATWLASMAALPAISLPGPIPPGTLPVGMQLMASRNSDDRLLDTAEAVEELLLH